MKFVVTNNGSSALVVAGNSIAAGANKDFGANCAPACTDLNLRLALLGTPTAVISVNDQALSSSDSISLMKDVAAGNITLSP